MTSCLHKSHFLAQIFQSSKNETFDQIVFSDKQKEEALILILKRKAELLRDIERVKRDVEENQKEIAFFEDPVG